jgi:putative hydrolase of HD superfamily
MPNLRDRLAFLTATDALKHVTRANRIIDGSRQENVAEHTWHVTLLAMLFADAAPTGTDHNRVRDLLITHDLVEIHAGDTVIWDNISVTETAALESEAAARLFALLPEADRSRFVSLCDEFAAQNTVEARFARAIDALHPMFMSWGPAGVGHPNPALTPSQVLDRKRVDIEEFPLLWELAVELVTSAAERGLISPGQ